MENIYEKLSELIPSFQPENKESSASGSVFAYLDAKYKEKEDFQKEKNEEIAYYNQILTKLTNQFIDQAKDDHASRRESILVSIVLFDADISRTMGQVKLLDFACQTFLQLIASKGYPPSFFQEKDETYSDACEGTCVRRTRFVVIPIV